MNIYSYISEKNHDSAKELNMNIYEHEMILELNPEVKNFLGEPVDINIERLTNPGEKIMTLTNWVIRDIREFGIIVNYADKPDIGFSITSSNMSPFNDINVFINHHDDDSTVYELFNSNVSEYVIINTHYIQPNYWYKLCINTKTLSIEFCILVYAISKKYIKFKYYDAQGGIVDKIEYVPLNGTIELVENNMVRFIRDDNMNNAGEYFNYSDIMIEAI